MSERSDVDYLQDIQEAIRRIRAYTAGMSYEEFLADEKTQDAVVRNLEVLGEAAKRLSQALKQQHPTLPWRAIAGARDRLIHDYSAVNLEIVWAIVQQDLPGLATQIEEILRQAAGNR